MRKRKGEEASRQIDKLKIHKLNKKKNRREKKTQRGGGYIVWVEGAKDVREGSSEGQLVQRKVRGSKGTTRSQKN